MIKMMRKSITNAMLCIAASLSLVFAVFFAFVVPVAVKAEKATVNDTAVSEFYFSGDEIELPLTADIVSDGVTYEGKFTALIMPDGNAVSESRLTLTDTGAYKVCFAYEKGGKRYIAEKGFNVLKKNWEVGSTDSSVTYGTVSTNESGKNSTGLTVKLAAGDTFTYNEPVDLRKNSITDIITMFSTAVYAKQTHIDARNNASVIAKDYEAGLIEVKLTDCYDPGRYVTGVIFISRIDGEGIYARTRASVQGEFGLYYDCPAKFGKPEVYIDGERYGVYNGDFGQSVTDFAGKKYVKWSINNEKGDVYISAPAGNSEKRYLINQLYNEDIGGAIFNGFTTGEVFVSITSNDCYTNETTFEIEQIGGKRGEALVSGGYTDTIAPTITVDRKGADGDLYIKRGEAFELFGATAYDPNLIGGVKANVYYNYGTSVQSSVLVKDGRFIPTKSGTYVIEYSAKDSFGNVGKQIVYVFVMKEDVASIDVEQLTSMTAGISVTLPEHNVTSLNGKASVAIKAVYDKTVTLIDPETRTFTPLSVGEYTIVYEYTDKLKTYEYSYTVNSLANDKCGFANVPVFDRYYIKGLSYSLPEIKAYEFKGAKPTEVACEIYVSFDGGAYEKADFDETLIKGSKNVRFKYVARDAVYESESIEIVDTGYNDSLNMKKYFKGDFSAKAEYSYIGFKSLKNSGSNSLLFINPLAKELFSITYSIPETSGASAYSVILTDREDPRIKTEFSFFSRYGTAYLSVNGGEERALSDRLNDGKERRIYYNAEAKSFVYASSSQTLSYPIGITGTSYGYAEIVFSDASLNSEVRVMRIQNQLICKDTYDDFAPEVYADVSGSVEIGTKLTIKGAAYSDALSAVKRADARVSVTKPSGGYALGIDGKELKDVFADEDLEITLSEYGVYRLTYTIKDANGRMTEQPYGIEVADMLAPTVTFNDGSDSKTVQTIKLAYKYKIKEYTLNDNYDSAEDLTVHTFIYDKNGVIVKYGVSEFSLAEEGEYTVYVYCVDTSGNYGYASYKLKVVARER